MTQLEALKVAYEELSNMMPYEGENDEIFEAANKRYSKNDFYKRKAII